MSIKGVKRRIETLERRFHRREIICIHGPDDTPEQRAEQARALAEALETAPPGTPVIHIDAEAI